MVMRKMFFGTIVFFSLAFLAACGSGGSGSSGATGATGAAGAAGSDGSISVPSDSDLALATVQKDMDSSLLEIDVKVSVTGLDNESSDSRLRYYVYAGTSSTTKSTIWDPGAETTTAVNDIGDAIANGETSAANAYGSGIIDTRNKTAGNTIFYLDTAGGPNSALPSNNAITGGVDNETSVTHMIMCAGNEAGDAASCASVAVRDRIAANATFSAAATSGTSHSQANVVYANSHWQFVADNATAQSRGWANDNGSTAYKIDDNGTKALAYDSVAHASRSTSTALVFDNNSLVSNVTFIGTTAYIVVHDNDSLASKSQWAGPGNYTLTVYKRLLGEGDWVLDNQTRVGYSGNLGDMSGEVFQIGSDGTDLFMVTDNNGAHGGWTGNQDHSAHNLSITGAVWLDNGTRSATAAGGDDGGWLWSDNVTQSGGSSVTSVNSNDICSVVTTDKMIVIADNGSTPGGFDVFTLHDNGSMVATTEEATVTGTTQVDGYYGELGEIMDCEIVLASGTYILALRENGGDNVTVLSSTDLSAWSKVYELENIGTTPDNGSAGKIALAAPNGTADVWVAVNDGSNVDLYHSDNGTSGGLIQVHSVTGSMAGSGNAMSHNGGSAGSATIGIAVIDSAAAELELYYE